jgi:hypothetical protein
VIKNIFFFNHFHNGDLFASRKYVEDIIEQLPDMDYTYAHIFSPKVLKDVKANYADLNIYPQLPYTTVKYHDENTIYINTWIGHYPYLEYGIAWLTYHVMFAELYSYISNLTGHQLVLKDMSYYIPEINFEEYDVPKDLELDYENSIMFSNGPVNSGQSHVGNIDEVVSHIAKTFPEKKLILTAPSSVDLPNIVYAADLIKTEGGDLNEISYLAEKCKYVIGRNSGPFCFMHTKNILNDETKNIISFGCFPKDYFNYGMTVPATYSFLIDSDLNNLLLAISDLWGRPKINYTVIVNQENPMRGFFSLYIGVLCSIRKLIRSGVDPKTIKVHPEVMTTYAHSSEFFDQTNARYPEEGDTLFDNMQGWDILPWDTKENLSLFPYKEYFDYNEKLNKYIDDNVLKTPKTLGIHFRGTDHAHTARIEIEDYVRAVEEEWATGKYDAVFIASEELGAVEKFKELLACKNVIDNNTLKNSIPTEFYRTVKNVEEAIQAGFEVVLDSHCLANCDVVFGKTSNVTNYAQAINPDLDMRYLDLGTTFG